jgi:hypothetical protein
MDFRKLARPCYRSSGPLFTRASQPEPTAQAHQSANGAGIRLGSILAALSILVAMAAAAALLLTASADPAPISAPLPNEWYP